MADNSSFAEQLVVGEYLEPVLSWFWEDNALEVHCQREYLLYILKFHLSTLLKYDLVVIIDQLDGGFCGSMAVS